MMKTMAARRMHGTTGPNRHVNGMWPTDACECLFSRKLQQVEVEAALLILYHMRDKLDDDHVWTKAKMNELVEAIQTGGL